VRFDLPNRTGTGHPRDDTPVPTDVPPILVVRTSGQSHPIAEAVGTGAGGYGQRRRLSSSKRDRVVGPESPGHGDTVE